MGESPWKTSHGRGDRLEAIFVNLYGAPIDETPFISCKRICHKLQIAKTAFVRVVHEDLEFRKCYLKWVPHLTAENKAQCRVTFSQELPQVMRHAKKTNFEHLLTGDE
jgi:hypothetical protein